MMGVEHIRDIAALDGVEVAALCDPDAGSLAAARRLAGDGPTAWSDHRDLLADGGCDAVVVATPNMTHVDILLDVIAAGVPVLVEKPLCTTVADCRRVVDASAGPAAAGAASGGAAFVWVGLEYRYMPAIAGLIEQVSAGVVGTVRMVAVREHRFPFHSKVADWNRFNANTGGTLVEKCCHFFDLIHVISGARPVRVMASGGQDVNHLDERYDGRVPDILDNAYVVVELDSGARAMLDLCMFAEATRNQEEVSVVGDLGKVEALVPEGVVRTGIRGRHDIGRVDETTVENPDIAYHGHHHGASYVEHMRFRDALLSGSGAEVGPDDGLWSVAVGVAAQRSIAQRRVVELDEVLDDA
ncbi:MAG TPA: hypothetical protein DEP66_03185 [Acidimicrobiaceae bacterium]|nr:hypothetical protein [Acidimicrobiaceae bacterium]HCB37222.1 hypothetical protein [Acidimicrobiaceae bacterium]